MDQVSQDNGKTFKWLSADSPLPWLAYLVLFFLPWVIEPPGTWQLIGGLLGISVFLPIYLLSFRLQGRALVLGAVAILLISFAVVPTHANWTVISIYAAAMVAETRPPRRAGAFIIGFALLTALVGFLSGQHPLYWVLGVFLMIMIGYANVSRAMLEDKNRALVAAQDEVRRLAAIAERERIGRDLHDLLGRSLTLIAIKSDLAARLVESDPARAKLEIREVSDTAREALSEVRAALSGMSTASLRSELKAAREALGSAGIDCIIDETDASMESGEGAVLAMALREAITNVIRHSGANTCRITIRSGGDGIELSIEDDGNGENLTEGFGLAGARARLAAAGGALTLLASARGTRFVAQLPGEATA